ncbi:hypothetical protein PRIPAC_78330 [Pristionchus pacificus]|uniref:G protein-coupled receptor n=1 Tax=Pristionchus pacificus TaxID=54126 RepID=A0A2A6C271_PRIPA|nr:hypothetical protein PRIPAC_78330 [Pristionchus pacificus]|eukprot:PDM72250.1 G protein-coupled receptor [Pristionchus pacificus]
MELFTLFTLLLGFIGVIANTMLIFVIIIRTPSHMKFYSIILLASACCDLICLVGMMASVTKWPPSPEEFIVGTACIMEMHGVCAQESVSLCAYIFGVQELMYSATSALLCLSFAYRFRAIESSSGKGYNQFWIIGAVSMIFINSPLIPLYHHALTLKDPLLEEYRGRSGHNALTIMQYADPFTLWLVNYSMMSSLVPFLACLKLRKMTLA